MKDEGHLVQSKESKTLCRKNTRLSCKPKGERKRKSEFVGGRKPPPKRRKRSLSPAHKFAGNNSYANPRIKLLIQYKGTYTITLFAEKNCGCIKCHTWSFAFELCTAHSMKDDEITVDCKCVQYRDWVHIILRRNSVRGTTIEYECF